MMVPSILVALNNFFRIGKSRSGLLRMSSHRPSKVAPFTPFLISLEGNIGAGKSTLLSKLRKAHPEWIAIDEPVETWSKIRNGNNESILEVFYKDRKRWAYTFQNCALLTRFQNIETAVNTSRKNYYQKFDQTPTNPQQQSLSLLANQIDPIQVFLTERCLDTDYHVFTKMLLAEGSIDSLEIELYERLLDQLKLNATSLSAIVHINTTPLICAERIKRRGRTGEEAINLDYLRSLDYHQRVWIDSTSVPTLSADVTHDFDIVEQFIAQQVCEVRNQLQQELSHYHVSEQIPRTSSPVFENYRYRLHNDGFESFSSSSNPTSSPA
jgi:deoxyadenosine/deoxycytidine kinase